MSRFRCPPPDAMATTLPFLLEVTLHSTMCSSAVLQAAWWSLGHDLRHGGVSYDSGILCLRDDEACLERAAVGAMR